MTIIYAISGNGQGAGKTTLANQFADEVWSIAGGIRKELQRQYPRYDWYNKTQVYKDETTVHELNCTVRSALFNYGQQVAEVDPDYWVKKMVIDLKERLKIADGTLRFAVDDVRKVGELNYLKTAFNDVRHYHVLGIGAVEEPDFENDELQAVCDYEAVW